MKITAAGRTDKGRNRKNNEDSFLVDDDAGLYAVADGIGGHEGGEVASRISVEVLREAVTAVSGKASTPAYGHLRGADPALSGLSYAFTLANRKLIEEGSRDPRLTGMGTTLTAVLVKGKTAYLAHVGDSRAYLLRNGELNQVTQDHGMVAEQVRAGLITPEQARRSPYRHVITRALGIEPEVLVDHAELKLRGNDVVLLCTDGLTEMVEDREIERRLLANQTPERTVQDLIAAANNNGGVDNITVVVIRANDLR